MWKRRTSDQLIGEATEELHIAAYWLRECDVAMKKAERLIEQALDDQKDTKEPLILFAYAIKCTKVGTKHRKKATRLRRRAERR